MNCVRQKLSIALNAQQKARVLKFRPPGVRGLPGVRAEGNYFYFFLKCLNLLVDGKKAKGKRQLAEEK